MSSILLAVTIVGTSLLALYWIFYGQRKYNEMAVPKKDIELKAIIFDFDGVIIDSFEQWFNVFNETRRSFNLGEIGKEEFRKNTWGASAQHDVKTYFKGKSRKDIEDSYKRLMLKNVGKTMLSHGVTDILGAIKKKSLKIGLVTNSFRSLTLKILEFHKIKDYFDAIVTADDVEKMKPSPEPILKACESLKVLPQEAIYVGDTKMDYRAGKSAGCVVVGLNAKGDLMISKLSDLCRLL